MEDAIANAYKDAGVDTAAAAAFVESLKPLARGTDRPGTMGSLGGFGALFHPRAAGFRDPVLVAATDGVGTKLKLAADAERHEWVGVDLVAMCVNDVVVQGAEPLFFLDYFATGRLDPGTAHRVMEGVAAGCRAAGCALIGGETAEMPGMYEPGAYDLAGFAVGAVERERVLTGAAVAEGDTVLGLASDGLHSNGFSLVRRILKRAGAALDVPAPFDDARTLAEALLAPTRIYVQGCLALHRRGAVRALAHITGGGLVENIPRVLPADLGAQLDAGAWPVPPVFTWLAETGRVGAADMARTFNCGLGMIAVVAPEREREAMETLAAAGERVYPVGRVVRPPPGGERVVIRGWRERWPR